MGILVCGLAAETKVETPEGAMTIRSVAGKSIPVFTREPGGRVRFRMMHDVRKCAEQQPVLRLTLESGRAFRVAPHQVLFKLGMVECDAGALRSGDVLEAAFHYPVGYRFVDATGAEHASTAGLALRTVEPASPADLYSLAVSVTGCFFLSAGVLCKAAPAEGS